MATWSCATLTFFFVYTEFAKCANYEEMPNVLHLAGNHFKNETSSGRWLVIFHQNNCGGCIRYSDYFLNFAVDVGNWPPYSLARSQFRLASLDCSDDRSREICIVYRISGVPTLRYLPGIYRLRRSNPIGIPVTAYDDVANLRRAVVTLIISEVTIVNSKASNNQYELAVASNSLLENTLIILEFSQKLKQPMRSYVNPSLGDMSVYLRTYDAPVARGSPEYVRQLLYNVVYNYGNQRWQSTFQTTPAPLTTRVYSRPIPINAADLFLSLSKALTSDVSLVHDITGEKLDALKEFLSMLVSVLPTSEHYLSYLSHLAQWTGHQTNITGEQWAAYLRTIKFPVYSGKYHVCKGSKPMYRGYPCGLWLLFHALTVSHCEREAEGYNLPGDVVAHAMNRFIPRFFSCTVCAFHFAANSANIVKPGESTLPSRTPPSASEFQWDPSIVATLPSAPKTCVEEILWLNAVHNRVNERLSGSPSDDPSAPKVIYPPRWLCSSCWSRESKRSDKWVLGKTQTTRRALVHFLKNRFQSSAWLTGDVSSTFLPVNYWSFK